MESRQKGFSTAVVFLVIVALGIGFTGWAVVINTNDKTSDTSELSQTQPAESNQTPGFSTPKKGAHFESATPAHGSTHAAVPADIVIDFNFDLAVNSTIRIEKDGRDYGISDTRIDSNKLAMRRQMDKTAPDGIYTVNYSGCWPDKSCHDGHFQFAINGSALAEYENMTSQQAVSIKMSEIKFKPQNIRISKGTTITWINDDDAIHYINTDSHPAHTHVPGLNSKALAKGESYSYTFSDTGSHPYHCSAHAADMTGSIVVE